jgi:hypothetical protein
MNKRLILILTITVAVLYQYATAEPDDDDDDEGGNWLQSMILGFLETLAIQIGETLALKGLWRLTQSAINALRKKGVKTVAEKAAVKAVENAGEKIAVKEAEKLAETTGEKVVTKEAEKVAEKEGEKLIEKEAVTAIDKEAERLAGKEAEKIAETDAEMLARKMAEAEAERAVQKEVTKAAEKSAETAAEKVTEKIVTEEAIKIAEKEGEKLAIKTGEKMAEKLSMSLARLAAEAWNPFEWALFGITTALYAGLGLDASMFKPCETGFWTFSELPQWALDLINGFPVVGDIFQLIGELICFREGCGPDEEYNAGLCYPKCAADEKSDGATMCYKQYSDKAKYGDDWEARTFPAAPTLTSVTKMVATNTGTPLSTCPPGTEKQGLLCYSPCKDGYDAVGDRCWAHLTTVGNGVGNVLQKRGCGPDERDDGTVCWKKSGEVCADDCSKGWDGCKHRWWSEAKCARWGKLTSLSLFNDHCEQWGDWECTGGCPTSCAPVYLGGRTELADRLYCGGDQEQVGELCYDKCPAGTSRVPGMPNQCRTVGDIDYFRGSGDPMGCPAGETQDSLGLCYKAAPPGWAKSTLGMIETPCPEGTVGDFGVGCIRASHNRGLGKVALTIKMRERDNYYGHTDAGGGWAPDIPNLIRNAPGFN